MAMRADVENTKFVADFILSIGVTSLLLMSIVGYIALIALLIYISSQNSHGCHGGGGPTIIIMPSYGYSHHDGYYSRRDYCYGNCAIIDIGFFITFGVIVSALAIGLAVSYGMPTIAIALGVGWLGSLVLVGIGLALHLAADALGGADEVVVVEQSTPVSAHAIPVVPVPVETVHVHTAVYSPLLYSTSGRSVNHIHGRAHNDDSCAIHVTTYTSSG
ncbi:MAG: hypothetical protein Q8R83_03170 [Legionellaceae bacterium]|nr:hypothetical protein [Legionellaceae bacterium]